MKILIAAPYFYPKIGGMENYAYQISKGLKEKYNYNVVVLTSNHEQKIHKEELINGIKIYRLPYWFKLSNTPINPFWYFEIKSLIKKEKPDIIIAHSPVPFLADLVVSINKDVPIILNYHCGSLKKEKGILVNIFLAFYEKYILQRIIAKVDYLICSSDFVRNTFLNEFKSKSVTITPGVDINKFKPGKDIKTNSKSILYVGRIDKTSTWKGLKYLIEAFLKVRKALPLTHLSIAGGGDGLEDQMDYVKKLGIQDHVDFLGPQTGAELTKIYQKSDLLVLPSTTDAESFGMVLIEAMACKKPVIGSSVGGIPNVIDNNKNGFLVPPTDINSLSKAIVKILENPTLANRMGEYGYQKVIANYTWDKQIMLTNTLIAKIISKKLMNIIQIFSYYPPHLGGAEQRVRDLSEKLAQKGHRVEVFTSNIGSPVNKQLKTTKNLKVDYLPGFEFANTPIIPSLPFKLFNASRDSIIHVHIATAYVPEIVWLVSKIRRMSYIAHVRLDTMPSSKWGIFLELYKKLVLRRVLREAKNVIVLTDDYKYLINKKYGVNLDKISVIPNGNSFGINFTKKLNSDPTKLLFVGRLSPQKNIPLLLESFKLAYLNNKKLTLTIVGDGKERKYIEDFIAINRLKNIITCKGILNGQSLKNEYKKADIFLSTTNQESFGTVYIEAMASGLPIITSNVLGIRNVIKNGKNGLLVNQSAKAFSSAILALTGNSEKMKRITVNNMENVKNYSWDKIVAKFEDVYKEVLNEIN